MYSTPAQHDKGRRLNWRQAMTRLGCGKTAFFDLVNKGDLPANGVGGRNRWYWESDVDALLERRSGRGEKKL